MLCSQKRYYYYFFLGVLVLPLLFGVKIASANSVNGNCEWTVTSPDPNIVGNYYIYAYSGSNPTTTDFTTYNGLLSAYINTQDGVPKTWDLDDYMPTYTGNLYFIKWSIPDLNYQGIWGYTTRNALNDCTGTQTDVVTPTSITSFTYSTTTGLARIKGYWNATTSPNIYEQLEFYQQSTAFGIQDYETITATTTGLFDFSFYYYSVPPNTSTTTPNFGTDRVLYANIYQYNNNYFNDPFSGIIDPLYKTLLVSTTTNITGYADIFNIASSTGLFAYPEYECSLSSLTGCIKNALIWTFYPTEDGITQYRQFVALIQSKPPVGYFSSVQNSLNGLSATSTGAFNIAIPKSLKDYIFNPFDIAISGILWLFFLVNFYKRFKTIDL